MNEMIERVARAFWEALSSQEGCNIKRQADLGEYGFADGLTILDGAYDIEAAARAAILAIREPTEAMLEAPATNTWFAQDDSDKDTLREIYTAMIDAALESK